MEFKLNVTAGAVIAVALLALGGWYAYDKGRLPVSKTASGEVADRSRAPEFIPTNGGMLTIGWVKGYEFFERRSPSEFELKSPVGPIRVPLPFGETVSEIKTAAKYQYQIRLEKRWPIECSEARCLVRTGPVELAQPVAIYHEETERKTKSGWARFNKAENLEELNRSLGAALASSGNEPRNRDVGMRAGRAEVEKFVREWMVKGAHGEREIVVLFPGEQLVNGKPTPMH